ncbi:hypothetical protein ACWF0M_14180 [Kribbella sp. NPDC055110]
MTDLVACERLLVRQAGTKWDDDEAEDRHVSSRGRMAVWVGALGVPGQWRFFDLAVAFDPSVENNPVWMERLEADSVHKLWTRSR